MINYYFLRVKNNKENFEGGLPTGYHLFSSQDRSEAFQSIFLKETLPLVETKPKTHK